MSDVNDASMIRGSTADRDRGSEEAERIRAIAAQHATATENARQLAPAVVEALKHSGLMRAGAPQLIGAGEVPPAVALRNAETIARGDAAAGWCVGIAVTSSLLAGYLPEDGAKETLGNAEAIAAGVWAPRGRAREVDGGLVVSGRWQFCSGITHSDYFFGGCVIESEQTGAPEVRAVGLDVNELEILDTWHTIGLRGTGSRDAVANEVFVPWRRVVSFTDGPRVDTALYRFPIFGYFALSVAAAALGNAFGAIEELHDLALTKKGGGTRTLAEKPTVQARFGEAVAAIRAARAYYYAAVDEAWAAALDGPVPVETRVQLRLAAAHAARTSEHVARTMYDLGAGTAIYESSPLQRRLRDAETATAHIQISPTVWETAGRVLLDQPTNVAQF